MEARKGSGAEHRTSWSQRDAARAALFTGLVSSRSVEDLTRRCVGATHTLVPSAAVSFDVIDSSGGNGQTLASTGVSDYFLRRYEQIGRREDPVYEKALEGRCMVQNDTLMSASDWESLPVYENVFKLHRLARVLCAPIVVDGEVVATLNIGRHESDPPFDSGELGVVQSLSDTIAATYATLTERDRLQRDRAILGDAIDLCDAPMIVTDALAGSRYMNTAARRLLASIDDDAPELDDLIAGGDRQATVELKDGSRGQIQCRSASLGGYPDVMVSFPRLCTDDAATIPAIIEAALTTRERDVVQLAIQGLRDAEIAERLALSEHTIKQHLKVVYRKLGVRSRVELTVAVIGS